MISGLLLLATGIDVVISYDLAATRTQLKTQIRFPRSHRKRILKKWCKDPRNWITREITTPKQGPYRYVNRIICCPEDYYLIEKEIRSQRVGTFLSENAGKIRSYLERPEAQAKLRELE